MRTIAYAALAVLVVLLVLVATSGVVKDKQDCTPVPVEMTPAAGDAGWDNDQVGGRHHRHRRHHRHHR